MARIKGQEINIAVNPRGNKDLDDEEIFVPQHLDIRNGSLSDAGNWIKRSGYSQAYDTSTNYQINLMIDRDSGYAGNSNGQVFALDGASLIELTGYTYGIERPTWDYFDDKIIIASGAQLVKIQSGNTAALSGITQPVKYVTRVGAYTLYAGHDPYEILFSVPNNPESVDVGLGGGFFNAQKRGGIVRNIKGIRNTLYVFTDYNIEIWVNVGAAGAPFAKQSGSTIEGGTKAPHSVVQAQDTFFYFGDDNKFYVITGQGAQEISKTYRKSINEIVNPDDMYGIHFKKERLIRWFEPVQGKCYVYDYVHQVFSEDNEWSGGWQRMPVNSYMEIKNRAYIGDYDQTGLIYEWSREYKDDNSTPIRVFRKFSLIPSQSLNRVRFNRLRFRVKRGVGDYGETPVLFYRYRIDKGKWENERSVSLEEKGNYNPFVLAQHNLGLGREIEFELTETDAVDYVLTGMNLNVRELNG